MSLLPFCLLVGLATTSVQSHQQEQQGHIKLSAPTFQSWETIGNFETARKFHGSTLINNKMYIFGGDFFNASATLFFSDVQFLSLNVDDGTIIPNSLSFAQSFSIGRSGLGVASYNNYVYLVGGFTGTALLDDVQIGHVEENGQILSWQTSPFRLNAARSNHRLEVVQTASGTTYLVAIGGLSQTSSDVIPVDQIEVAEIYANASISSWHTCDYHLKGGRLLLATNVVNNTLYVIGGAGSFSLGEVFSDIQFAPIQNDGCPDSWSTSAHTLKIPLYGHTSLTINSNTFIVLGGIAAQGNYFNNVQFSSLHTDDVDTKPWILDRNQFSVPRYGHTSVQLNNKFLYVIGGRSQQQQADLNDIQMSVVNVATALDDKILGRNMWVTQLTETINNY